MAEFQPGLANPAQPQESLCGAVIGRFRIGERLGKGGMGEVYRAEDTKLKRTVALKRLAPALRADSLYRHRFLEEAERASRFVDSHVAAVYDVLEEQGEIFLILEYVEGQNLRQRLRQPLSLEEFFTIAVQCAEALVSAHKQGIVHCDIKPENIMLTAQGQVKVLDFGVAKHLPRSDQSSTVDRAGTFAGTPAYMSPEVLLEEPPDGRADVFSLGVVAYEVLTGQHPFLAGSFVATTDRIRRETPASIRIFNPAVSEDLEALVNKAMAKDPAQRYAGAQELLDDLRRVREGQTPTGLNRAVPQRQKPPAKPNPWFGVAAWVAPLIVVIAALVGVTLYRQSNSAHKTNLIRSSTPIELAVLPFTPMADDPGSKAFSNGLTQTLTAKLTQLSGSYPLQVVPTSEVRTEGVTSVEQARKIFGVGLVLEGTLHTSGNQVRVTYTLVDAKANRQVDAQTFDADVSDAFAVEDQVVDGTLRMLGLSIQGNDRIVLAAHGTADPSAYDQFLRGRGYLLDYHKHENIDSAISAFNRALTLDPKYAEAYAALGKAYWIGYEEGQGGGDWVEKARSACNQAVADAPKLAEAYSCLGSVYAGTGQYEKAVAQLQTATTLEPTSDDAFRGLAEAYGKLNKPGEAEATYRKAISLRPQYWAGYSWLGVFYWQQGRYDDAARAFQEVVSLAPDNYRGYSDLGAMYVMKGQFPDAISVLEKSVARRPNAAAYNNLGNAYFSMRKFDEAAHDFEEGLKFEKNNWLSWGNLGDAYYWAPGKRSQAGDAYREAIRLVGEKQRVDPRDARAWAFRATYQAMVDNRPEAMASLQKALSLEPARPGVQFRAALVYNHFGDTDRTLQSLQKALAAGIPASLVNDTPDFDHLRADPRFQAILPGAK
ncbi:MAG TPA: tetratricopeptide repeat protein [Terriglobales bacterium]|jgi:serine/threonine-protein kinase|nr:tetratricopeptide repeat protein [Terriglobales bacterium]